MARRQKKKQTKILNVHICLHDKNITPAKNWFPVNANDNNVDFDQKTKNTNIEKVDLMQMFAINATFMLTKKKKKYWFFSPA